MRWQPGDAIVRRDVWRGQPTVGWRGNVVSDADDLLVLHMPEGAPLAYAPDFFGAPHPWAGRDRWHGHGVLQLQRPGELHAVWVFWEGPERELAAWYVNIQEPFRRTPLGFELEAGRRWWSDEWAACAPDPSWPEPTLPPDWHVA